MGENFTTTILSLIILAEIIYVCLIPYNINKTANELEKIRKALEKISEKGD